MADITNPEAVKFSNEKLRPMCERVESLKAEIDVMMIEWFAGLNSTIGSSSDDDLIDGRDTEGVRQLTGDDITGVMSVLSSIQSTLDGAGVMARINKPTVRAFRAGREF